MTTKIEWTGETWNPIRARNITTAGVGHYCVHVSDGCKNCYAERLQPRFKNPIRYAAQDRAKVEIYLDEKVLQAPLHWKKPRMIFVCSMTDLFGDWVKDEWLASLFAVMALCPRHTFQILTKRPDRMQEYLAQAYTPLQWIHSYAAVAKDPSEWDWVSIRGTAITPYNLYLHRPWPLPNVWLGTSIEDQKTADTRIPHLLATPAAVRFISAEPLLGPVDLECITHHDKKIFSWLNYDPTLNALTGNYPLLDGYERRPHPQRLNWVIVGGESGANARPMHPDWARNLRDQCAEAGVPFFMKQMTKRDLIPDDLLIREFPDV